jgi:hypothetical protein
MSVTEQFGHIMSCQSTRELVPFLVSLSKKDIVLVRTKALEFLKNGIPNARPRQARGWTIFPPLATTNDLEEFIASSNLGTLPLASVYDTSQEESALFFLTGLATYNRKEAFGDGFHWWGSLAHDFFTSRRAEVWAILHHARPTWLGDWLMGGQGNSLADYWLLRDLEDAGFIEYRPQHFAFRFAWLALHQNPGKLTQRLIGDEKALTRDLPLQFEYEASIARLDGQSAANYQKFTWQRILLDLIKTGHLDRTDILTRCLLALRRDFRRPLLTWFKELFLALKPTVSERLARQADLVELLAHPLPLVVNFALEQLKNVWAEPGFNLAPLLLGADNLLTRLDLRTGLKTLLNGLGKLPKTQPAHAPAVARLLAAALAHPDTAVQEPAAKSLAALLNPKKPALSTAEAAELTAIIEGQAELLGAAARAALAPWLAAKPGGSASTEEAVIYTPRAQFVPELSLATAIVPVANWHELLFLTGQVLKHDDPTALERWLDGLLRLHEQLPDGHHEQLRPYVLQLVPQLQKAAAAEAATLLSGPIPVWGHDGLAEALLLSWANGFRAPKVENVVMQSSHLMRMPLLEIEQQRYAHAEGLLARRLALPLLSTPTHAPYWVAPRALVTKLLAYEAAHQEPAAADLALALARTAHSHPAEAAVALSLLPQLLHTGLRELLMWFFGPADAALPVPTHTEPTRRAATSTATLAEALPELWAIAARTKAPHQAFPALPTWLGYDYPGVAQPLHLVREVVAQENTYDASYLTPGEPTTHRWTEIYWRSGATEAAPSALLLYSPPAGNGKQGAWEENLLLANDFPYLASALPHYPAPLHEFVLRCATWADNLESSERDLVAQALRALLAPGPPHAQAATAILASGLLHHTALCRSLGQEVLLRAVANGQLLLATLGQVLGQQLATGYAPVPRLTASLATLGSIDALTDDALCQVLEALLPELPAAPLRSLRPLLDLYADLRGRTGRPTPTALLARLGEWRTAPSLKKVASALAA